MIINLQLGVVYLFFASSWLVEVFFCRARRLKRASTSAITNVMLKLIKPQQT
jgi:hypothetical protein